MALAPELIAVLACPKCKGSLAHGPEGFRCPACCLLFSIEGDIPNFLLSDAVPAPAEEAAPR